jgi:hypothetical protein
MVDGEKITIGELGRRLGQFATEQKEFNISMLADQKLIVDALNDLKIQIAEMKSVSDIQIAQLKNDLAKCFEYTKTVETSLVKHIEESKGETKWKTQTILSTLALLVSLAAMLAR